MTKKAYKKLSTKILYDHPRTTLSEDTILLPNGKESKYLVYNGLPDSAVLIVHNNGKILLSNEYTYPLDDYLLQIPGGVLEPNEDPQAAAQRELTEETGYTAKNFEYLGYVLQSHRRSLAKMHYFYVTDIQDGTSQKEEHEFIEEMWFSPEELHSKISSGEVTHEGTLAGIGLLGSKYPNALK